jgi:hypothetical protein
VLVAAAASAAPWSAYAPQLALAPLPPSAIWSCWPVTGLGEGYAALWPDVQLS